MRLTIIADPSTGLVYESAEVYRDAATAYRDGPERFRLLRPETRSIRTPDGCTVGENAAWLLPGEYIDWDGPLAAVGGP